jgi:hypothetical protein
MRAVGTAAASPRVMSHDASPRAFRSAPAALTEDRVMFRKLTRLVYGEHRGARPFVPRPLPPGEAYTAPGGQSRYLWTDAFGVLNFVTEAARCAEAGDEEGREDALAAAEALVDEVCFVLGQPRSPDLPMAPSPLAPLRGARDRDATATLSEPRRYRGLRIGKRLASAVTDPGMALDGMYFHYVDKFVFALARLGEALGGAATKRGERVVREACAVVADVHDLFVEREAIRVNTFGGTARDRAHEQRNARRVSECVGIRWKLNADGKPTRGLPPTRLSSDVVCGAVAWSAASRLAENAENAGTVAPIRREVDDMREMATRLRPAVSLDPLGWGMQMWELQWVPPAEELAERSAPEWRAFAAAMRASSRLPGGDSLPVRRGGRLDELPFRAYGALLGARVGGSADLAETAARAARDAAAAELAGLGEVSSASSRSEGLTAINRVMLASALDPLAFRRAPDEPRIF